MMSSTNLARPIARSVSEISRFSLPSLELQNLRVGMRALAGSIFFMEVGGAVEFNKPIDRRNRVENEVVFDFAQLAQEEGRSISEFDENSCFSMTGVRLASVPMTPFTSSWAVRQSKFLAYGAQVRPFRTL